MKTNVFGSVVGLVLLSACGGVSYVPATVSPVSVPSEYEADRHDAIVRALAAKRYAVETDTGNEIVARWSRGDAFYRVRIDVAGINLSFIDSDAEPGPAGTAPRQYARYMQSLRREIEGQLGRPMRDQADAAASAAEDEARRRAEAERMEQRRLAEEARRRRTIVITSGATMDEIRRVVMQELRDRSYTVESDENNVVTARWSNDDRFYRLTLTMTAEQIVLQYVDSDHRDDGEEDGVQIIDERYIDYMGRLERDIIDEING